MKITDMIKALEEIRAEFGDNITVTSHEYDVFSGIRCMKGTKCVKFFRDSDYQGNH